MQSRNDDTQRSRAGYAGKAMTPGHPDYDRVVLARRYRIDEVDGGVRSRKEVRARLTGWSSDGRLRALKEASR